MRKSTVGDLTLGTARIGAKVRCVRVPNMGGWDSKLQSINLPQVGCIYHVRSCTVCGPFSGVLLKEISNQQFRVMPGDDTSYAELFFPYDAFNLVSTSP